MRSNIVELINNEVAWIRAVAETKKPIPCDEFGSRINKALRGSTVAFLADDKMIEVRRHVPGTKNDDVNVLFRASMRHTPNGVVIHRTVFVGAAHYLHGNNIAAVHRDGGAATCLCGYETPTTYRRIQQVARVVHRSHKRSAYIGKMPIDPYRVYIHPSGIPFPMPQYNKPEDWLWERAQDKEFDDA